MRRLLLITALCVTAPLFARNSHRNVSIDDDGPITDCSQLRVRFNDARVPVVSEELTAAASLRSLKIDARTNGGIRVDGWDQNRYGVTVCKAVPEGGDINSVRVNVGADEISATGPEDDYYVYYLVHAPRNADIDVGAVNGPVSVSATGGTIKAHTINGPISLSDVEGNVDAQAVNGPISFRGNRGSVTLHAQNGPISVHLAGSAWEGGSFDARTSNGPLSLHLPRAYGSGVVVESSGHGPVSCHADACRAALDAERGRSRDDDDEWSRPRRLEFGSGNAALHFATSNGPISISDGE